MFIDLPSDDYIPDKVEEICRDIGRHGGFTRYPDIFLMLEEYIQDNIIKFLPEERDYDIND